MFRRVLVANRGEIAARVIRACHALGVEAVAVYSEADAGSPHLDEADQRICIGAAHARHSYLDQEAILEAAHQTGCQALHPGYGFLSESWLFAARCRDERITFIGPEAASIRTMGDKVAARRAAVAAGLPVIPGTLAPVAGLDSVRQAASETGYPLILKAVAGGGGRGMRRVDDPAELESQWETATGEAAAAFGDGSMYVERYIEGGRHIEVQVLADRFGNVVHLGERECSVQRNHQKLIEETPSPALSPERSAAFGEMVRQAIARLGYRGAGTVEFLLDPATDQLYFLEMNTRLQVEHPVTEMTTGVDIVEWQLRIAASERLGFAQADIERRGHAIECRINAEDPEQGFRPAAGRITTLEWPATGDGDGVRVDTHLQPGYEVPPFYDSLLAKMIAWAPDRDGAIDLMLASLAATRIEGVPTTIPLHARVLDSTEFRSGVATTSTLVELLERWGWAVSPAALEEKV